MSYIIELLRAAIYGIVQGVTEWLPVSSTGHMILLNSLLKSEALKNADFFNLFLVVIQLGSIFAVIVLYFNKLFPLPMPRFKSKRFSHDLTKASNAGSQNKTHISDAFKLWQKIFVGIIPVGIVGFIFDDIVEKYFYNNCVIAAALIIYGIAFILVEKRNKSAEYKFRVNSPDNITFKDSLMIGAFQALAIIPGTSRSGSTILGAMLIGVSRPATAEFSFFLAVPVMFGASTLKLVKYILYGQLTFSSLEISVLLSGCTSAFIVSLITIRFLIEFVKKHSLIVFGIYRIILGIAVIAFSLIFGA